MTSLADILADVIREHQQPLNDIAERHTGPIEVSLHWNPRMAQCSVIVRPVVHLPPYHAARGRPRALAIGVEGAGQVQEQSGG